MGSDISEAVVHQLESEAQRRDHTQEKSQSCRDLGAASQCQLNRLQALKAGLQQQSRGWWGSAFWSFRPDPQSLFHASVIPLSVLFKTLTALSRLVHLSDLQNLCSRTPHPRVLLRPQRQHALSLLARPHRFARLPLEIRPQTYQGARPCLSPSRSWTRPSGPSTRAVASR